MSRVAIPQYSISIDRTLPATIINPALVKPRSTLHIVLIAAGLCLLAGGLAISRGGSLDELGQLALGLALVVPAALAGGHIAARFGQPAVLGELLAGMLLGNLPGLQRIRSLGSDSYLDILSQVGMLLLLFEVGLGLSVRDLSSVGPSSFVVAVIGTAASVVMGTLVAYSLMPAAPTAAHLFLGAAIAATSVGITARVLRDMKTSRDREAKIILGAAVVDDVLALALLGTVTAWIAPAGAGTAPAASIAALAMKTVGFLVLAVSLGVWLTPNWFRQAAKLKTPGALLGIGLCFCFALAWAANAIGLAPLIGAFAAGLVLEDAHSELFVQRGEPALGELIQPMISFLVPVFFVLVGIRTNLRLLAHPALLTLALALTAAAIAGKLACAAGVFADGARRLTVAIGMVPRGEVTLVFAALGSTLRVGDAPLLDERGYASLVAVVVLTTLVTPPALKWSLSRKAGSSKSARSVA
jgi:Kef-type K+ transport system membrane component KefB